MSPRLEQDNIGDYAGSLDGAVSIQLKFVTGFDGSVYVGPTNLHHSEIAKIEGIEKPIDGGQLLGTERIIVIAGFSSTLGLTMGLEVREVTVDSLLKLTEGTDIRVIS